jgi:hypothetical protein
MAECGAQGSREAQEKYKKRPVQGYRTPSIRLEDGLGRENAS